LQISDCPFFDAIYNISIILLFQFDIKFDRCALVQGADMQGAHLHGADITGALIQGVLTPGALMMLPQYDIAET
jgi:hypothetical protein